MVKVQMVYDQNVVVDALDAWPEDRRGQSISHTYEAKTLECTLAITFDYYDNEVTIEWFLPSGHKASYMWLTGLKHMRCGSDPSSKFLELQTEDALVQIWFLPLPRLSVLTPPA
jgi:hypothetical protein